MSTFEQETKEFAKVPENDKSKYPMMNILIHNTVQFAKVGSFLGSLASYPLRKKFPIHKTIISGVVGGLVLSVPVSFQKWMVMSKSGIEDRAFRLKHNKIIKDSDMMFLIGTIFGGIGGNLIGITDPKNQQKILKNIHSVSRKDNILKWAGLGSSLGFITLAASMAGKNSK